MDEPTHPTQLNQNDNKNDKNVRSAGNSKSRKHRPLTSKGKRKSEQSNDHIDPYDKVPSDKEKSAYDKSNRDDESDHAVPISSNSRNLINLKHRSKDKKSHLDASKLISWLYTKFRNLSSQSEKKRTEYNQRT